MKYFNNVDKSKYDVLKQITPIEEQDDDDDPMRKTSTLQGLDLEISGEASKQNINAVI